MMIRILRWVDDETEMAKEENGVPIQFVILELSREYTHTHTTVNFFELSNAGHGILKTKKQSSGCNKRRYDDQSARFDEQNDCNGSCDQHRHNRHSLVGRPPHQSQQQEDPGTPLLSPMSASYNHVNE